jgi:hypothetical protein
VRCGLGSANKSAAKERSNTLNLNSFFVLRFIDFLYLLDG